MPKKKKSDLMISHGRITHPIGAKCKVCAGINKEFKEAKKSGKLCKLIGHRYVCWICGKEK